MNRDQTAPRSTIIDVAGARVGGAAKFLGELSRYLDANPERPVHVIGRDRSFGPTWLARREVLAREGHARIALNNAGFTLGRNNVTLLRNALHFASSDELEELQFRPSRALRAQTRIVRAAAHRSTRLVVPCDAMAERVRAHAPRLAEKLLVRAHPVSPAAWAAAGDRPSETPNIFLPILNAPYKRLHLHVARLLTALDAAQISASIVVTAHPIEFAELAQQSRTQFTGPLQGTELEQCWRRATAVYFPTQLESFGYPLAEARVYGIPVIAVDSGQNRQIAGAALRPFREGDAESLADAVRLALTHPAEPDPEPFSPQAYFDWLLDGPC